MQRLSSLTEMLTDGRSDRRTSSIHKQGLLCNPAKNLMYNNRQGNEVYLFFTHAYLSLQKYMYLLNTLPPAERKFE